MGNCAVTKFNRVLDNNNLLTENECVFKVRLVPNNVVFGAGNNVSIVCDQDLYSYDGQTLYPANQTITMPSIAWLSRPAGLPEVDATIKVLNKYNISSLNISNVLEDNMFWIPLIHNIRILKAENWNTAGLIQSLLERSTELYDVELVGINETLDFSKINISEISILRLNNVKTILNLSEILVANYLNNFSVLGAYVGLISGSLEQFIINVMGNPSRQAEQMTLELPGTAVTFNGTSEHNSEYKYFVQKNGGNFIVRKWNASGDILGTYNGSAWSYT